MAGKCCHICTTSSCHTLVPDPIVNHLDPKSCNLPIELLDFGVSLVLDPSVHTLLALNYMEPLHVTNPPSVTLSICTQNASSWNGIYLSSTSLVLVTVAGALTWNFLLAVVPNLYLGITCYISPLLRASLLKLT